MGQALDLYTRTFTGDTYFKAKLGGDFSLLPILGRASLRAALLEGYVYAAIEDKHSDRIISMGIWFAPGTRPFATEAQRSLGYEDWLKKLSPEAVNWNKHTVSDVKKRLLEPMFTAEELRKGWWCSSLFTDIDHRRKGCARAIVNKVAKRASDANEFLALITSLSNVLNYEAMGFEQRGTYILPTLFGDIALYVLTRDDKKDQTHTHRDRLTS
ncbi:hypothetical protein E1B28_002879 [Marasmius oreades]|nr:uncharacterized protein E1B28_002879 [Marasmius oreades]KAG7086962.1 hypothetical protein E1B28_002879 [Marasmius oreades]